MSVDAIGAVGATADAPPVEAPPASRAGGDFQAVLQRAMDSPRDEIERVRAQVASFRDGGILDHATRSRPGAHLAPPPANLAGSSTAGIAVSAAPMNTASVPLDSLPGEVQAELTRQATGDSSDPYGWRRLSRDVAESIVGPGFGPLFERQIHLESGFAPDVVYGLRVSSAGAEGIAQLMPQYYADVNRRDPHESLIAGARTMEHNLTAWDGDVAKALASYNAGLGRVRQLVNAHGDRWEEALPAETRKYLAHILGDERPTYTPARPDPGDHAVFGGRGPGGVLTAPVDQVDAARSGDGRLELPGTAGGAVRAPADGTVLNAGNGSLLLDHGNGWTSRLDGLASLLVQPGTMVGRSDPLGTLGASGLLQLGLALDGRRVDPARYLLHAQ